MIIKYLWIEKYKRFENMEIFFNDNKTRIEEEIFKRMKLTLLVGENGAGKTTVLSFISHIFRNIERYHERIPSDFIIRYYKQNCEVEISKKESFIFFNVDGVKKMLLKTFLKSEKSKERQYKLIIDDNYPDIEKVQYCDIKSLLPSNIIVSAFDIDYPDDYAFNYKGDRLLQINTISLNYKDTAFDMGISLGIYKFLKKYFLNDDLKSLMNTIKFKFSDKVCIYRPYDSVYMDEVFVDFYEEFGLNNWSSFLKKYKFETKSEFLKYISSDRFWGVFCEDIYNIYSGFEGNEFLNIKKFLECGEYNTNILERMIESSLIYINEFFIIKDNVEVPLRGMSTGEKMFLCRLLYILSRIKEDSVIILEEPEIHLNHSWVKQIISIITLLFNDYNVHFIISTHSYTFINNVFTENILLIDDNIVKNPDINTFLANERSINYGLFKGSKNNNLFEDKTLELIRMGNRKEISELLDVIGESYYKFLAFKRLDELEENYVESE